jgi:hypothetical protein
MFLLVLLIIIIIILIYLYVSRHISGTTLAIILLALALLLLLFPALIGIGFTQLLGRSCLNKDCSVIKLPFNLTKIGRYNANNIAYSVGFPA